MAKSKKFCHFIQSSTTSFPFSSISLSRSSLILLPSSTSSSSSSKSSSSSLLSFLLSKKLFYLNKNELKNLIFMFTSIIIINLMINNIDYVNGQEQPVLSSQSICQTYFSKFSKQHTACVKPNRFCMIKEQGLDKKQQKLILNLHNYYRNLIASGNESNLGFPSAANMLTLEWDDELAYVAQKHADQCRFEHDCYDCRRTEKYPVVGQNLYIYRTTRSKVDPDWKKVIREWYEEIKIAPPQVAFSFDLFQLNIGHFTQMAWADTNRIGCGFSSYLDYENPGSIFKTVQLYTCNYAPGGNFLGEKMYENGLPSSKCPPQYGQSKHFQALCEFIQSWETNINSFTSFDNHIDSNILSQGAQIENPSTIINNNNNNQQYSTIYTNNLETSIITSPVSPVSTTTTTTTTQRTTSTRTNSSSNRGQSGNNRRTSTTTTNRNRSRNRQRTSNNNQKWNKRLNNWKNNSTTISTTLPTTLTSSWKWNQSSYDWKKWLTNYTTFSNWKSKPQQQRSINNNNNNNNNRQSSSTNRITTRLPTYTWSLSFGENEAAAPKTWSRSIDLTPNNNNNNALYYRYNFNTNRYTYY